MGVIVNLDNDIKSVVQTVFDDLLLPPEEGGLGKHCLIVYPPRSFPCTNCIFDPVGQRSTNRHRSGGPVPFSSNQPCPMCSGRGRRYEEVTEDIVLRVNWDSKTFVKPFPGIELKTAYSVVETKGYLSDLPKLLKAEHIIVDVPIAPFIRQKYKMSGEPGAPGSIIQARYAVAYWERWNG